MLINDVLDDLSRLFKLFSRISNGLDPIADIFKQHILNIVNEKIEAYLLVVKAKGMLLQQLLRR
jgi:hypothetical protein